MLLELKTLTIRNLHYLLLELKTLTIRNLLYVRLELKTLTIRNLHYVLIEHKILTISNLHYVLLELKGRGLPRFLPPVKIVGVESPTLAVLLIRTEVNTAILKCQAIR